MRAQYAGVKKPEPPTISFGTGSITSVVAGSYSAYLQNRNRAGVTTFSERVDFAIQSGQSVVFTLPGSLRQPASDLHEVILSIARNSSNPLDACVVATWAGYEQDGVTERSLPATITLTSDEHLGLGKTVSNSKLLPQNPIHGMRRYVDTDRGRLADTPLTNTFRLRADGGPGVPSGVGGQWGELGAPSGDKGDGGTSSRKSQRAAPGPGFLKSRDQAQSASRN